MLDYARRAVLVVHGRTLLDLEREDILVAALLRYLQVIGDAARRVSPAERERHPEIPWQLINGIRNRIVHEYDELEPEILWRTASDDLPRLVRYLESILP